MDRKELGESIDAKLTGMQETLAEIRSDFDKLSRGMKAPAGRMRKSLSEISRNCKSVRELVLNMSRIPGK